MDEQQLFDEFAEDTLNSKMSIGAFTLYTRCYVARLLLEIDTLHEQMTIMQSENILNGQIDHIESRCISKCFGGLE